MTIEDKEDLCDALGRAKRQMCDALTIAQEADAGVRTTQALEKIIGEIEHQQQALKIPGRNLS